MWLEWGKRKVKNSGAWQFLQSLWQRTSVPTTAIVSEDKLYEYAVEWATTFTACVQWPTTVEEAVEWGGTHSNRVNWED